MVVLTVLSGIVLLVLRNCRTARWLNVKNKLSVRLSTIGTLIFVADLQPYAAFFTFALLIIKTLLLIKWARYVSYHPCDAPILVLQTPV